MVDLVKFLRESVKVQDPNGLTAIDPAYLELTDAQLSDLIQMFIYKESPMDTVTTLRKDKVYPVLLLSKLELYHRLAVKEAPLYPVSLEGGTSVRKNVRFDHYMELIKQAQGEYEQYVSTGVPITVGEVFVDTRYQSNRNYNVTQEPTAELKCDNRYVDKLEVSWEDLNVTKFGNIKVYVSTSQILDRYDNYKVSDTARLVAQVTDIHQTALRISDLITGTNYHVAMVISEMNGVKGYVEQIFATL